MRGKPARNQQLLIRGELVSVISFLSTEGILSCSVVQGSVNSEIFYDVILKQLVKVLMPYDGVNKNCVVIMDNGSIHHIKEVDTGAILHFLLQYSLDYNPIENAFSKVNGLKHLVFTTCTHKSLYTIIHHVIYYHNCIS